MIQPDLFSYPHTAGHRHQRNSIEGAKAVQPRLQKQRELVYELIEGSKYGMTNQELCDATGIKSSTISGRIRELKLHGRIDDSGLDRKSAESGVKQTVWVACD